MNDYINVQSREVTVAASEEEREFQEKWRGLLPILFAGALGLMVATGILAFGELITWGVFIGAVLLLFTFVRPEIPMLVITLLAPMEIWLYKLGSMIPGTGLTPMNFICLVLIVGAWIQRHSRFDPSVEATPIDKAMAWFLFISGMSVVTGALLYGWDGEAVGEYMQMFCAFSLYLVVRRRWRIKKMLVWLVVFVCMMTTLEAVQVTRQYRAQTATSFEWKLKDIIKGTMVTGNSNDTGAYISQYGMIAFGLFLAMRRSFWRFPALAVTVAAGAATFFTYSRAAYWALAAAIVCMVLYKHRRYLLPVIGVGLLLPGILPSSIAERLSTRGDTSAEERKEYWKEGMIMSLKSPVWGVGWRGYSKKKEMASAKIRDPHSMYVLVASEQGLVGLVAFLYLLMVTGTEIMKAQKAAKTPFTQGLALGLFGCYVALLVNNVFGSRMVFFFATAHFWMLVAGLLVLLKPDSTEPVVEVLEPVPKAKPVKEPSPWRYRSYV